MTTRRYERLVDAGIFGANDRVELLDGLLVAREPQGSVQGDCVAGRAASLDLGLSSCLVFSLVTSSG